MSTCNFGRLVREKRESLRISLAQAAELCDLSDRGLSHIELGDADPKLSSLLKIATAFKINLGDIECCKLKNNATQPAEQPGRF